MSKSVRGEPLLGYDVEIPHRMNKKRASAVSRGRYSPIHGIYGEITSQDEWLW